MEDKLKEQAPLPGLGRSLACASSIEKMKATTKVVSFGLNFNGQLGYECYDNKNPRSVNAPSDLISLHAGWNCSVAVNSTNHPSIFFFQQFNYVHSFLNCCFLSWPHRNNNHAFNNINTYLLWGIGR